MPTSPRTFRERREVRDLFATTGAIRCRSSIAAIEDLDADELTPN